MDNIAIIGSRPNQRLNQMLKAHLSQSAAIAPASVATPLVGTGSVVGLPVLRAQKLIQIWEERARVRDVLANESRAKGNIEEALPLENSADAYEACALDLRREVGLPIPRQPEPNK
jgi:hypothetical protein